MKRITNSDIKFKLDKKLIKPTDFSIKFYTVNTQTYSLNKTNEDVVVEDDEYIIDLDWWELVTLGRGVLQYKAINNTLDNGFMDNYYNRSVERTTEYFINTSIVPSEDEAESLSDLISETERKVYDEINRATSAESAICETIEDNELATSEALNDLNSRIINIVTNTYQKTEVDALISGVSSDVSEETERATAAESGITNNLNAEIQRATNAESGLSDSINAEITRATAAESGLSDSITSESTRATAAESGITDNLNAEITRATAAESGLSDSISAETNRATAAESGLSDSISAEITRATNAESGLSNNITAETTRATNAESGLSDSITSETSRATTAENFLSGAIDTKLAINDFNTYSSTVPTLIEAATSGKTDTTAFTAHTSDTNIHVTTAQTAAWDAKSDFSGSYNDLTDKPTIPTVPTSNSAFTNDAGYITIDALSPYAESTAVTQEITAAVSGKADTTAFTAHTSDATIHVTTAQTAAWDAKSDFSGSYNDLTDKPTIPTVPTSNTAFTNDAGYITVDALSGYAESTAVTQEITAAVSGKQDTLSAGTNITISGNVISAEGGGSSYTAGRGIAITTGETADTISFDLPISAGTGTNSAIMGAFENKAIGSYSFAGGDYNVGLKVIFNTASGSCSFAYGKGVQAIGHYSHAEGYLTLAQGNQSHAEGFATSASADTSHVEGNYNKIYKGNASHAEGSYNEISVSNETPQGITIYDGFRTSHAEGCYNHVSGAGSSHAEGYYNNIYNFGEHASGYYNNSVSASTTVGDSGNTLFSVGNGTSTSARHNAFEIRQNGDIYCSDGTNDVKLQDTITATAANTTALGGFKLVQISQSDYDALTTKDNNTLYVIV